MYDIYMNVNVLLANKAPNFDLNEQNTEMF